MSFITKILDKWEARLVKREFGEEVARKHFPEHFSKEANK